MEFQIKLCDGEADRRQLELLQMPRKYIRQYLNDPPFYYAMKVMGIWANYFYLMREASSPAIVGTILLRRRLSLLGGGFLWKIHAVYVAPELRGKGLGQRLVDYALARLREMRAREVTLKVDADNEAAIRLYRKCGFADQATTRTQLKMVRQVD